MGQLGRVEPHRHPVGPGLGAARQVGGNVHGSAPSSSQPKVRQRLCFALALWNGRDPLLKERMFGLTNGEGNHGEDVKAYYFYLDATPTHSYLKFLYKYPQAAFPYAELVATNRAPVWFSTNLLLIRALLNLHAYYGDGFTVECPTGSGRQLTLYQVAREIAARLTRIFLRDETGRRPSHGGQDTFQTDPHWRDLLLFYEYFHGDNGAGIGASHQTGWTGLAALTATLFHVISAQDWLTASRDALRPAARPESPDGPRG